MGLVVFESFNHNLIILCDAPYVNHKGDKHPDLFFSKGHNHLNIETKNMFKNTEILAFLLDFKNKHFPADGGPNSPLTINQRCCTVMLYILEDQMTIQTTYTLARNGLAKLLDQVTHDREVVIIKRRGEEEVAMIAASELESLMETAYLLRSPANAGRLLSALGKALKNENNPITIDTLREQVGFE
jgi:antitoxin YefM